MGGGFFLGGMAEGAMGAQQQALRERVATDDAAIRNRGLDLQGRQLEHNFAQDAQKEADARIAETMGIISETIKQAQLVGTDPQKLMQGIQPALQSAQAIAQKIGRDPNALAAQVAAQIARPTGVQTGEAAGTIAGRQRVAQEAATQQVPLPPAPGAAPATPGQTTTAPAKIDVSPFTDPKDRVSAEGSMRDDFTKASTQFVTIRDFYDRMKTATPNGAGDISLVFSFMKLLDPTSTVREGEYATASNAAGVPSAIHGMYNKLVSGGVLGGAAREQIKGEGAKIWSNALTRHSQLVTQYTNIAKRQGLRPQNVVVDYTAGSEGPIPPPPAGFTILGR